MSLTEAEREEMELEVEMRRDIRAALENSFSDVCGLKDLDDVLLVLAESPELAKEEILLGIMRLKKLAKLAGITLFDIN